MNIPKIIFITILSLLGVAILHIALTMQRTGIDVNWYDWLGMNHNQLLWRPKYLFLYIKLAIPITILAIPTSQKAYQKTKAYIEQREYRVAINKEFQENPLKVLQKHSRKHLKKFINTDNAIQALDNAFQGAGKLDNAFQSAGKLVAASALCTAASSTLFIYEYKKTALLVCALQALTIIFYSYRAKLYHLTFNQWTKIK